MLFAASNPMSVSAVSSCCFVTLDKVSSSEAPQSVSGATFNGGTALD
jgi:hypothetical protein